MVKVMARQRSQALTDALAMVASGATVYAAAKAVGLSQSSISRTITPPAKKPRLCQHCNGDLRVKKVLA